MGTSLPLAAANIDICEPALIFLANGQTSDTRRNGLFRNDKFFSPFRRVPGSLGSNIVFFRFQTNQQIFVTGPCVSNW